MWQATGIMVTVLLTDIDATDLLSFETLRLRLDSGLNVVVGQNDVGKSNLIRLVKLVRDAIAAPPGSGLPFPYNWGFEQRFVRLGGPGFGRVSIGVRFDEHSERALLLLLVRAIAAQYAEPPQMNQPRLPDEWVVLHRRIADFVEGCLSLDSIAEMYEGRIVMALDARQPFRWSLAYEFDHGGAVYHLGIQGQGVSPGSITRGPLDMDRVVLTMSQPDLSSKMDPSSTTWVPIELADLLPSGDQSVSWSLQSTQTNLQRPLTLQLTRELGLAADNSRLPNVWWVFGRLVSQAIVTTENIRRPPRRRYGLDEIGAASATEDAGDLPLDLYRRKNGDHEQRTRFARLQNLFLEMTARGFDVASTVDQNSDPVQLDVDLQVQAPPGWIPIEHAGAGLWEALVALSAAVPEPGQVVLLDEPATHLHASWQLDLLRYLRSHHQVVLITHSPFLVPAETLDDFNRVVRLVSGGGDTVAVGISQSDVPEAWRERWRQTFASSADARNVLFVRGVLLVEGDTEIGAFRRWFNDALIVGTPERGLDARNLAVVSVDGDRNFSIYVSYLERMQIPWAVLCDGPALSPRYRNGLIKLFAADPDTGDLPTVLIGSPPDSDEFADWKKYWASNGVFCVADAFGVDEEGTPHSGDTDSSGEIERFFRRIDENLWSSVKSSGTSKVRRGYRFAEELDLQSHPHALRALGDLWTSVVERLDH